jgi:hypothetical protein
MLHVNPLNAKLNPICHLLALLGDHHILHVSRIRVKRIPNADVNNKHGTESNGENVHSLTLYFNIYNFIFGSPVTTTRS